MGKFKKVFGVIGIILIITLVLIGIGMYQYTKQEEAKLNKKVHHVFKQKGWENKVKKENNVFTFNTGYNYLQVTFKDEPYHVYNYYVDDNKISSEVLLKDKYDKFTDEKRQKRYEKRMHFEKKYTLN